MVLEAKKKLGGTAQQKPKLAKNFFTQNTASSIPSGPSGPVSAFEPCKVTEELPAEEASLIIPAKKKRQMSKGGLKNDKSRNSESKRKLSKPTDDSLIIHP
jgi:hypothetical protein